MQLPSRVEARGGSGALTLAGGSNWLTMAMAERSGADVPTWWFVVAISATAVGLMAVVSSFLLPNRTLLSIAAPFITERENLRESFKGVPDAQLPGCTSRFQDWEERVSRRLDRRRRGLSALFKHTYPTSGVYAGQAPGVGILMTKLDSRIEALRDLAANTRL